MIKLIGGKNVRASRESFYLIVPRKGFEGKDLSQRYEKSEYCELKRPLSKGLRQVG